MLRIVFRVLTVLVMIGLVAGLGAFIYNAGVTQGLAASGKLPAVTVPAPGTVAPGMAVPYYPFYPHYGWGWGWGFRPFGFLIPLLFLFLFFALLRGLFWGRRMRGWGWGGPMMYGEHGPRGFDRDQVPPFVAEWHKKMHEEESGSSSPEQK